MLSRIACTLCACLPALAQAPVRIFEGYEHGSVNGGFGAALAGLGDLDGDGHADLVVGAPYESVGSLENAGRVRVLSGAAGTELFVFEGVAADARFGTSVAGGDVNQDGWPDILVGAPGYQFMDIGTAWLFSGRDGSLLFRTQGIAPGDGYGFATAVAGDVDGDAFLDLVIGAPSAGALGGYAEVRSGWDGALRYRRYGTLPQRRFGTSVSGAGDLDGDGFDDVVVGEPQTVCCPELTRGEVFAFTGSRGTPYKSITLGQLPGGLFGYALSRIGDLDGDGRSEILIGALGSTNSAVPRGAHVWNTATNQLVMSMTSPNPGFGSSLAGPGDLSGDGVPDFVVGSPQDFSNGSNAGAAMLYSGSDGALLWQILNVGDSSGDQFGTAVAAVGDVDGDGRPDIAVGAPWDSPSTGDRFGRVVVFSFACPTPVSYCTAKINSQGCTPSIGSSGAPSFGGADDFFVVARDVINNKSGLMLWSLAPAATPFNGGTLCLAAPIRRTQAQSSGGNPPPNDCSGTFQFHFAQSYLLLNLLAPGSRLFAQYWYRDPASAGGSGLSDALDWVVCY